MSMTIIRLHESNGLYTTMTSYYNPREQAQDFSVQQYTLRDADGGTSLEREALWSTLAMAEITFDQFIEDSKEK